MSNKDQQWDDYWQCVVFSINTNKSASTGFTAFYPIYGRQPRLPFEVDILDKDITPQEEQIKSFVAECQTYEEVTVDHT